MKVQTKTKSHGRLETLQWKPAMASVLGSFANQKSAYRLFVRLSLQRDHSTLILIRNLKEKEYVSLTKAYLFSFFFVRAALY